MAEFAHLHVHSEYSLLDGLSSCRELADRAVELRMRALALTDHGAMYGAIRFYKACRAASVKPIIGMETYVAPRGRQDRDAQRDRRPYRLILLAQNDAGYHNLMCLATLAQLEGFYYKPRVDKDALAQHADGLVVLSGCGSSELSRLILDGQVEEARRAAAWYRDVFPGRYFLELQDHGIAELAGVDPATVEPIATGEWPSPAPRPAWSVLDCSATYALGIEPMPPWHEALAHYLKNHTPLA